MAPMLGTRPAERALAVTVDELQLGDVSFYDLAEHFHTRRDFALLDSQTHEGGLGVYSFLSFEPFARFISKDGRSVVQEIDAESVDAGDPLAAMQRIFDAYAVTPGAHGRGVPFCGGAMGYLAYELGRQIEVLPQTAVDELRMPDCYLCFYNFAVALEHTSGRLFLCRVRTADERIGRSHADIMCQLRQVKPGIFARASRSHTHAHRCGDHLHRQR